jgi:NTE family protein
LNLQNAHSCFQPGEQIGQLDVRKFTCLIGESYVPAPPYPAKPDCPDPRIAVGDDDRASAMSYRQIDEGSSCVAVFAGGMSLGAYGAGAFEGLVESGLQVRWVAGSSIGAVNAALIAGNPPHKRLERLQRFWSLAPPHPDDCVRDTARHARAWASVLRTRLDGVPGHFVPRLFQSSRGFVSTYDLGPMDGTLSNMIDFDLLNSGAVRYSLLTTDLTTGEGLAFDTGKGDKIEMAHILASCGLPPEFAPVEIEGRTLGDGGLNANAPFGLVSAELEDGDLCIIADNFNPLGRAPDSMERASARKSELMFSRQTTAEIAAFRETEKLKSLIERLALRTGGADEEALQAASRIHAVDAEVVTIAYRAPQWEAGPEMMFDYSTRTIYDRWQSGRRDVAQMMRDRSPPVRAVSEEKSVAD